MKTHLIMLLILTSTLFISGCGGGEEEAAKAAVEDVAQPTTAVEPTPQKLPTTGELISAPEFNLRSSNELQVDLPASPSTVIGYFINICTDFSKTETDVTINYASCKLRTKVALDAQQFNLVLSPAEKQLIAQIWPMEDGAQPISVYWNTAESGNNWQVSF